MRRGKLKKTSVVILAALTMFVSSFSTSYAADIASYKFTILRNATSTNDLTKDQIWKTKKSGVASVKVTSASSPKSFTTYKVCSYDTCISNYQEMQNKANNMCYIKYNEGIKEYDFLVNLRGIDARQTAPNYSTVKGKWSPIKNNFN